VIYFRYWEIDEEHAASKARSQQANGRRPTPSTGCAVKQLRDRFISCHSLTTLSLPKTRTEPKTEKSDLLILVVLGYEIKIVSVNHLLG